MLDLTDASLWFSGLLRLTGALKCNESRKHLRVLHIHCPDSISTCTDFTAILDALNEAFSASHDCQLSTSRLHSATLCMDDPPALAILFETL